MERREAEAIYDAGREVVVEMLLRMDRQIQQLTARVDRLERELAKNSRNSSQPPSSDRAGKQPPKRGKGRSPRSQGAQPGHEGRGRDLLPSWAVDEIVEHWPARCRCGHVFAEADRVAISSPARHQVEELPQISVALLEHQCQRARCPGCGEVRSGELPAEVAGSAFGPRPRSRGSTEVDVRRLTVQCFGAIGVTSCSRVHVFVRYRIEVSRAASKEGRADAGGTGGQHPGRWSPCSSALQAEHDLLRRARCDDGP